MAIEVIAQRGFGYRFWPEPLPTGNEDLIRPFADEEVVVGNFEAVDTVFTPSHRAIYSEMHIRVDHTIFPADSSLLGRVIDVLTPGGTVLTSNETVLSFQTAKRVYELQPRSRYVLFLRHLPLGDFYLAWDSILLDGDAAKPNSPDSDNAVAAGRWPYLNLSESALVQKLLAKLAEQQRKTR